jgi:hypothetical protein
MNHKALLWVGGLGVVAVGVSLLIGDRGSAGDDKSIREGILKIATGIAKGDASAAAQAKSLASKVEEVEEVMNLFKLRTKKGLGIGSKAGSVTPDGIELMLNKIGRDAPSQNFATKEAEALEEMAFRIAAVAEVVVNKPPKGEPAAKQKDWVKWAKEMREAAPKLAEAAKTKSPAELQKAAAKINAACNNCHSVFK